MKLPFGAQVTDTTEAAEQEPAAEEADPCASARAGPQEGERPKALLYTPPLDQDPGPGLLRRSPHLQSQQQSLYFIHISLKTTESGRRSPRPSSGGDALQRARAAVWFSREGDAQTLEGAAKQLSLFALTVTHTGVTAAAGTGG